MRAEDYTGFLWLWEVEIRGNQGGESFTSGRAADQKDFDGLISLCLLSLRHTPVYLA